MDEEGKLVGDVTLMGNKIKKRHFGETIASKDLKSEQERVEALQTWLGVKLSNEEACGIRGRKTELT